VAPRRAGWPRAHPRMKGLTEMVKKKEGAEEVAARLERGLQHIDLGEWTRYSIGAGSKRKAGIFFF
jgi:hypothetical protein